MISLTHLPKACSNRPSCAMMLLICKHFYASKSFIIIVGTFHPLPLLSCCAFVMLFNVPGFCQRFKFQDWRNQDLRGLPWVANPFIPNRSCRQVSSVVHHFGWQLTLLRFAFVLRKQSAYGNPASCPFEHT